MELDSLKVIRNFMSMGVESLETELPHVSVETKWEGNILLQKENKILNQESGITFGSHGTEEPGKKEVNTLPENSIPKDAVDEWPAPKQIHTFYMVKYRLYDDQKTKSQLDQANGELKKLNQARYQLSNKIRAKKTERAQVYSQWWTFIAEIKQHKQIIDEKRKEIEPLHQALGVCSSEEELNDVIKRLAYRIQHESIPLTEEKQILREIRQLEGTREKVIANAVVTAKIKDSMGGKESIQDQVKQIGSGLDGARKEKKEVQTKQIGSGLDGARKEKKEVQTKVDQLDKEKKALEVVIAALEEEGKTISEDKEKILKRIRELRKQLDQGNAPYYKNRATLIKARELAASKDVEGLRDHANTEVDTFMSLWSSTKAFRDDYERRILPSLDKRQLSRDGRMRNPDEKPLVVKEPPPTAQTEIVAKPQPKQVKEDSTSINQKEKSTKQPKEPSKEVPITESIVEVTAVKDTEYEKSEKDHLPVKKKVDEAQLKELKREEEIAKAKQAQERKKKLAEEAAAKAAIKAQKEAEKKQKDRAKKAAKKAGKKAAASVSVSTEEPTEATGDMVSETGTADEAVQAVAAPKSKERKERTTVRLRGKGKGPDSLPKIILKRKKATNYWTWAAAIAAILAVLLSVLGYYYMM